jgi:transcriptional regulator with XRE-family HTH domain
VKGEQNMYEIFAQLLEKYNVTPYKVSKETGVAQTTLSDWKRGRSTPKSDTMKKIADYFGVSVDYLMTGSDKKREERPNPFGDIKGIYLSYAKEAQDSGIDPDDIRLALDTIKRLRGEK